MKKIANGLAVVMMNLSFILLSGCSPRTSEKCGYTLIDFQCLMYTCKKEDRIWKLIFFNPERDYERPMLVRYCGGGEIWIPEPIIDP